MLLDSLIVGSAHKRYKRAIRGVVQSGCVETSDGAGANWLYCSQSRNYYKMVALPMRIRTGDDGIRNELSETANGISRVGCILLLDSTPACRRRCQRL